MRDGHYIYKTHMTCASEVQFDLIDGYVRNIRFTEGCGGGTQGVAAMADGLKAEEVVMLLKGTPCHEGTSCPDQLARAIEEILGEGKNNE